MMASVCRRIPFFARVISKMSHIFRRSPQASKILAVETKSVESCAKTIQLRIRKSSRVIPDFESTSPHTVIHIISDTNSTQISTLYKVTVDSP
jgi:hypothetical protein